MSAETNLKRGERRNVTVLFADMKGFTGLSEQMDPEEMDALMSRVFGIYESIIKSYGGTVEKYIGDALVAVFGVPELHEDDASRAVNASLDFLEQIDALNRRGSHRRDIEFRVGIHTGLITTGKRGEHEVVTGHAMAVASRLQSGADPGTILVSEATRRNVAHDFTFGPGRQVEVRGEAE
ncbi:MAG: adenylate/guanylate cyclase domain-containing protein, partial [Spirochaetota bacterium]